MKKTMRTIGPVLGLCFLFLVSACSDKGNPHSPDLPEITGGLAAVVCQGEAVRIGPDEINSDYDYSWFPTSGLDDSKSLRPLASPATTTVYTLGFPDYPDGVTDSLSVKVTVILRPEISITADQSSFCSGGAVDFSAAYPDDVTWIAWDFDGDGTVDSTLADPSPVTYSDSGEYTASLSVISGNGCGKTETAVITVYPMPADSAGPDQEVCAGGTITLNGSASGGTLPYIYEWSPAGSLSDPAADVSIFSAAVAGVYEHEFRVTDINSCSATDQMTITVKPLPIADAGSDYLICQGDSVILGRPAASGHDYSWSPSTGLSGGALIAQPAASPATTTTYTLTVTNRSSACASRDQVRVFVNMPPVIEAGESKSICKGTITFLEPDLNADHTYFWRPSQADPCLKGNENRPNAPVCPVSTTTYALTVTHNVTGCTISRGDTVTITVNLPPLAEPGGDQTICQGQGVVLGSGPGNPKFSYRWSPANDLDRPNTLTPTATPLVSRVYTLTVEDPATSCADSATAAVRVLPAPVINAGADRGICLGSTAFLNPSFNANYEYFWKASRADACLAGNADHPNAQICPAGDTTYSLRITDSITGCPAISGDSVNITVNPLPATEAGPVKSVCAGGAIRIGSTCPGCVSYSWFPAGSLDNPASAEPMASPATTTVYLLTAQNGFGCFSSDPVTVTVIPLDNAQASLSATSSANTCYPGSSSWYFVLNASDSSSPAGIAEYRWDFDNNGVFEANSYTAAVTDLTYPLEGRHTVRLEILTAGTCPSTDVATLDLWANPELFANAGPNLYLGFGSTAQLGGPASGGNSPYAYAWSPGTYLSAVNIAQPYLYIPDWPAAETQAITYSTWVTDTVGCSDSDSAIVSISDALAASAGPDRLICGVGNTASIGYPAGGGIPPYSYAWWPVSPTSPTVGLWYPDPSSATVLVAPSLGGSYTYTEWVTDSVLATTKDSVMVTVSAGVIPEAGADRRICAGDSVQIGNTCAGCASYSWDPFTGLNDPSLAQPWASPATITVYSQSVADAAGCTGGDTVQVWVDKNPVDILGAGFAGSDRTVCAGSSVQIGQTAQAGYSYLWSPNSGLSDYLAAQPYAWPLSTTSYVLNVTDLSSACSSQDELTVFVNEVSPAEAGPDRYTCGGSAAQIGSPGTSGHTYHWTPEADLSDPDIDQPLAAPPVTTVYTVRKTDNLTGCYDEDSVTVTVGSATADAGPDKSISTGGSTPIGTAPQSGYSYSWTCNHAPDCYIDYPQAATPTVSPVQQTIYTLTATNPYGCSAEDQTVVTVYVNIIYADPPNGDTATPYTQKILFTFSEAMGAAADIIFYYEIYEFDGFGGCQAGDVTLGVDYEAGSRTALVSAGMQADCDYRATVKSGVTSQNGNTLATDYIIYFHTIGADTTPPGWIDRSPSNGETNVPLNSVVTITFNEDVDPASVTNTNFTLWSGATLVTSAVIYDPVSRTAILTPQNNLALNTQFTARVANVADLSGNTVPVSSPIGWSFTTGATGDFVPPAIVQRIPAPGAVNVIQTTDITAVFSENINPGTVNASTFVVAGPSGQVTGIFSFPGGTTAVFSPDLPLASGVTYTVVVQEVRDLAGNAMSGAETWSFTTGNYLWNPDLTDLSDWDLTLPPGSTVPWAACPGDSLCMYPGGGESGKNQESCAVSPAIHVGKLSQLYMSFEHFYDLRFNPVWEDLGYVQIRTCEDYNQVTETCDEIGGWSAWNTGYISYPDQLAIYRGRVGGYIPAMVNFSPFVSQAVDYWVQIQFFIDLDQTQPSYDGWWVRNILLAGGA